MGPQQELEEPGHKLGPCIDTDCTTDRIDGTARTQPFDP